MPGGKFDLGAQFADGQLATFGAGRWMTPVIRDLDFVEPTRILNWPTNAGNGTPVGWDAWPILKSSKNPDAAWTFLRCLTTFEASVYSPRSAARHSGAQLRRQRRVVPQRCSGSSELLVGGVNVATPIPSPDDRPVPRPRSATGGRQRSPGSRTRRPRSTRPTTSSRQCCRDHGPRGGGHRSRRPPARRPRQDWSA